MSKKQIKKIGLLVGFEQSFPPAFIEKVNEQGEKDGIVAEFPVLGGIRDNQLCEYSLIVDRISHEVDFYKPYLKFAALNGTYVINDPFWWIADDKFFGTALVGKLGVAIPRTVVLPTQEPHPNTRPESYRNTMFPLNWEEIFEYIGFPAFLKAYIGGGWKNVYKVNSPEELFYYYNQTGRNGMILQENIAFEQYVRCVCIGKDNIKVIRFDPSQPYPFQYILEDNYLKPPLEQRIIEDARKINHALDYDMNSVEFAIRDGVPYAIDFMNPAPDMDVNSLTPHYFRWAVERMADMAIRLAKETRPQRAEMRWNALF